MSKKKATLEDFLASYIKNREIKNSPLSYNDYLRSTAGEYKENYNAGRLSAAIAQRSAEKKHGVTGESLASGGLLASGYADHLNSLSRSKYKSAISALDREQREADAAAKRGYYKYLSEHDEKQTTLKGKVVESLIENEIIDTNAAYDYAISAGLAPEEAAAVSQSAHNEVRRRLRLKVISDMFKRELSPDMAAEYAIELGLGESDAADIARIAEEYKKDFDGFTEEYLDYLESIGNKTTVTFP